MSSNCPPQLHLSIQPNTTSFKRSFEQFGFDLGSPVDGGGGSSNNGNDRNKRARSASSFSDSNDSMESSSSSTTLASSTNGSAGAVHHQETAEFSGVASVAGARSSVVGPPRLPTPDIQDIEMADYSMERRNPVSSFHSQLTQQQNEERFRLSLERFNAFDSQIAILRQSRPTSPVASTSAPLPRSRLPTPPPILPPLSIPSEEPRLSLASTTNIPFLPPPLDLSTPLAEVLFGNEGRDEDEEEESEQDDDGLPGPSHSEVRVVQGFQARLSSALERLRPQSPLVPGLSLEEHEEENDSEQMDGAAEAEDDQDEAGSLTPDPPTLPPIPSGVDIVHFSLEDLLSRDVPEHTSSNVAEASSSSSLVSPTLGEHPLPSPILRDLHNWIDGRQSGTDTVPTSSPAPVSYPAPPVPAPGPLPERVVLDHRISEILDNYDNANGNSIDQLRRSGQLLDNLWERRSLELWNDPTDEAGEPSEYRPPPNRPRFPLSFDYPMDRTDRLEHPRRRVRISSSSSLVTENALEARRRADHDDMIRPVHARPAWWGRDAETPSSSEQAVQPDVPTSLRRVSAPLVARGNPPYLHLPPIPTPSLDDPLDDREEEERLVHELVTGSTSRVPRTRWYASTSSSSARGVTSGSDWLQRRDEEIHQRRSQQPSITSASTLRERMSASTSAQPQNERPSSPLLSPLGNLDLELFPNGDGEASPPEDDNFIAIRGVWRRNEGPQPGLHARREYERRLEAERPPSLPPPDLGNTFDSQDQVGLVAHFREQYRQRARSFRGDDNIPTSVSGFASSRPSLPQRNVPHSHPTYSFYDPQNPPPRPSHPSHMLSTPSYRPQPTPAQPTPQEGPLDWRHQTLLRLEENRQHLQFLNERQRNLEAYFEGRASRTEAPNHSTAQPLSTSHDYDNPNSTRPLLGTAGERHDNFPVNLSEYDRRRHEDTDRHSLSTNVGTAPSVLTEPPPPPSYLRPLYLEERARNRNPVTSYPTSALDPEAFAPGPFRNTMAMQQRLNRVLSQPPPPPSHPPSIPPLPFQDSNPVYPPYSVNSQLGVDEENSRRFPHPPTSRPDPFSFGLSRRIPHTNEERAPRRTSGLPSLPTYTESGASTSSPSEPRPPSDLHRYLTQHVRMEPSRLESPSSPAQGNSSSTTSPTRTYPSPSHVDPMRPNGHNSVRQLQLMQQRQVEMQRVRAMNASNSRYTEGSEPDMSSNNLIGGPFFRRIQEHEGFASWRNRRRVRAAATRLGGLSDFVHDDDFDDSYEGLLNLAASLGDVKPKSTPSEVLEKLEKGRYQEWKTQDGEKRCPICLDDYADDDRLLKLNNCTHWLHHDCLQQWLNTANTCPVCRESVQTPGTLNRNPSSSSPASRRHYHYRLPLFRRGPPPPPPGAGGSGSPPGSGSGGGSGGWASAFRGFD